MLLSSRCTCLCPVVRACVGALGCGASALMIHPVAYVMRTTCPTVIVLHSRYLSRLRFSMRQHHEDVKQRRCYRFSHWYWVNLAGLVHCASDFDE
jgi:hypothetical protein